MVAANMKTYLLLLLLAIVTTTAITGHFPQTWKPRALRRPCHPGDWIPDYSSWQAYTSQEKGIRFRYPKEYIVTETSDDILIDATSGDGPNRVRLITEDKSLYHAISAIEHTMSHWHPYQAPFGGPVEGTLLTAAYTRQYVPADARTFTTQVLLARADDYPPLGPGAEEYRRWRPEYERWETAEKAGGRARPIVRADITATPPKSWHQCPNWSELLTLPESIAFTVRFVGS